MKNKIRLSVVLATRNEEKNIGRCLSSVKTIANEIIIFDEHSEDNTARIARSFGAKVYETLHNENFHITKQKSIDKAKGDWVLQLDADEVLTPELATEIKNIISFSNDKLLAVKDHNLQSNKLFYRHQKLIEKRDGKLGEQTGEVVAFFIPRVNMFFGKPLIHGGVYPDPAIRLIKRGKASLPAKDVHEIMEVEGEVAWLINYMEHYDSPNFKRYIWRNNRYTDLIAKDFEKHNLKISLFSFIYYVLYKPTYTFLDLYLRHKGILDGFPGLIWCFFSALRFPISFFKYWRLTKK